MADLTSIIYPCCNQGNWVRETIPLARESMGNELYEIICIDDQSTDGCCHGLDKDVKIYRTENRLGVSGARRFAADRAKGNIYIFSDPHCTYPDGALGKLVEAARDRRAVCLPRTVSLPGQRRTRFGGRLVSSPRGLRMGRSFRKADDNPALIGAIYSLRAEVYWAMDGWPHLPGVWGYSEQAMSMLCMFSGIPISIVREGGVCNHRNYHKNHRFSYNVPRFKTAQNAHAVHYMFLPKYYQTLWQHVLKKHFGEDARHTQPLKSGMIKKRYEWLRRHQVMEEEEFYERVLGWVRQPPPPEEYIEQQRKKSRPSKSPKTHAIEWLLSIEPKAVKNLHCLDLGCDNGDDMQTLEDHQARQVQGVDIVPERADACRKRGLIGRHGDMQNLPDPDNNWDLVMAIHSLEHCKRPQRAFNHMLRVLKPGGRFLIAVPREDKPHTRYAHNSNFPTMKALEDFVKGNPMTEGDSVKTNEDFRGNKKEMRITGRKKR